MGVDSVRIKDPREISKELNKAIKANKPKLIELMIDGSL